MRRVLILSLFSLLLLSVAPQGWSQNGYCPAGATLCLNDVFQLVFFDNAFNRFRTDQTIRIVNPGVQGTPITANEGKVCADIYVFNANQQMEECCACSLTANDLLQLGLRDNLLQNPMIDKPDEGVIMIISDRGSNCDPTAPIPTPNLRASIEHLEVIPAPRGAPLFSPGTPSLTDTAFEDSELSTHELQTLSSTCAKVIGTNACTCS